MVDSGYPKNPALYLCYFPFVFPQTWMEEPLQTAVRVAFSQPFGSREGILLVAIPAIARKTVAPRCRVDFDDGRLACGYLPTLKRPEMYAIRHAVSEVQKPRNACMGGLRHRSGHVKMKNGFGPCSDLRQASPPRITASSLSVSTLAFPNEIDVGVVHVCRPMLLKVGQKRGPFVGQTVFVEIFQWERKAVVNTNQCRMRFT